MCQVYFKAQFVTMLSLHPRYFEMNSQICQTDLSNLIRFSRPILCIS